MEKLRLELKNITEYFGGVAALSDVSFEMYDGEILAIVGENGAGKSTLMKILSGVYPKNTYTGNIIIDSKERHFTDSKSAGNAGVAMIYQEINVELDLSVAENIFLGILPSNKLGILRKNYMFQEVNKVLKLLGVDIEPNTIVRKLTPSIQQLICIARALVRNPKILILDEPTSSLTKNETEYLLNLLKILKKRGISCLYISHKLDEVFSISDRIVVMRDGKYINSHKKNYYDVDIIISEIIGRKLESMYPQNETTIGGTIFEIKNLTIPHPYTPYKNIVDDISFTLNRGEILGLAGLVGSGRSEILNAIFGAIPHSSNTKIILEGKEIHISKPKDAISMGIGLLTEDRKLNGYVKTMSVSENTTLASLEKIETMFNIIDNNKERNIVDKYIKSLSIKIKNQSSNILTLSGGNQQKVLFAKWLLNDLKIIMLDEPTRGVDVGAKYEIYKLMRDLTKKGISIIMISSELPELVAMCDRFIVLNKNKISKFFSKESVSEEAILQASAF